MDTRRDVAERGILGSAGQGVARQGEARSGRARHGEGTNGPTKIW